MSEVITLREWQTVGPHDNRQLAGRFSFSPENEARIVEMSRSRQLDIVEVRAGLRISTTSYVGVVHLGPITLRIQSKLAELCAPAMATILRYALGMEIAGRGDTDAEVSPEMWGLPELIAGVLLEAVNELLRTGILRDYETRETWRTSPRGRIDFTALTRSSTQRHAMPALPCRISKRAADTVLNRLVGATLEAASRTISEPDVAFDLQCRAAQMAELCACVPLNRSLWTGADAAMDRRSACYQPILEIADFLLRGAEASPDNTARSAAFSSFLVDMNLVFERFVCRLLSEFGSPRHHVELQVGQGSAYRWSENPHGWKRPRLRPDVVLFDRRTGKPALILDMKYKSLGAAVRPSLEDLYQLTLYSMSFGRDSFVPARIVFPDVTDGLKDPAPRIEFHGVSKGSAMASIGFYGLPMLPTAEALRQGNEVFLRLVVATLTE